MNLREWKTHQKISNSQLAKMAGITSAHVSYLINGHRAPSLRLAARLINLSNGLITLADLRPEFGNDSTGL